MEPHDFLGQLDSYIRQNFSFYKNALDYSGQNSLQDYILQVMSGTRTIDDLDTFMADWKNAGGEDVRNDLQTWYDEFYG